ncbi:MAG: hypothetical protein AAFU64_04945, partial [Bacteroidota bacterium]
DYFAYRLEDKFLFIQHYNFFLGKRERQVRLDEIAHRYEKQTSSLWKRSFFSVLFLIILSIFLLQPSLSFFVYLLVMALIGLFSLLIFVKHKFILLSAKPEALVFPIRGRKESEIESFVQEIIHQSKQYLIWRYGQIDPDLPQEPQFRNFKWLRDIEALSEEEYQSLKDELKRQGNDSSKKV